MSMRDIDLICNGLKYMRNIQRLFSHVLEDEKGMCWQKRAYHNGVDGWKTTIKAVKDKYPK